MIYRVEYDNGLTRSFYSSLPLQEVHMTIPQEGLRSLTQYEKPRNGNEEVRWESYISS